MEKEIFIFTDGSSRGNPGPGGFGAIVVMLEKIVELGGREIQTTNNRMELTGAISALSFLSQHLSPNTYNLSLFTDSSYVVNGITKWVFGWQKNEWKKADGEDVLNKDLWEKLFSLSKNFKIDWKIIPGHAGVAGNERCDEIATSFADGDSPALFNGKIDNYKIKLLPVEIGAVEIKKTKGKTAYSYISAIDGIVKVHGSWKECEARVKGKAGARFKKSFSKSDEEKIIKEFT
ncbi:MAG: ribonuclease [Patescibacteria group bacterium]|jgi:ribonuclease HI|nr:ribonuclease [Patescibacteria group bacterium]